MSRWNYIFPGRVEGGRLKLVNENAFREQVKTLDGKDVELCIRKKKRSRSTNQNAYYWGVVIKLLANHCGYTDEEMHEALKFQFLRVDGIIPTVRSTSDLTTSEFLEYISFIQVWASDTLGVYIPDPNELEQETP